MLNGRFKTESISEIWMVGPSQGTVKVLLTALGNTLQDGRMGTGTCQWQGNRRGNIVSSVTLQGKLCYCVHWTALLQIMRL